MNTNETSGAILDEVPKDDKLSFKGSCVVAVGASKEEVIEKLKEDVYAKNNVWDFDNVSYALDITQSII